MVMNNSIIEQVENEYQYGFSTDIESNTFQKGLNEDVIRAILSVNKNQSFC